MKLKICACQWWPFGVVGNTWEHMGCSHAIIEERGNEKHSSIVRKYKIENSNSTQKGFTTGVVHFFFKLQHKKYTFLKL